MVSFHHSTKTPPRTVDWRLAKVLNADNGDLYEKLVQDMGETEAKFQAWWEDMANL